jgi:hypothetical protein
MSAARGPSRTALLGGSPSVRKRTPSIRVAGPPKRAPAANDPDVATASGYSRVTKNDKILVKSIAINMVSLGDR